MEPAAATRSSSSTGIVVRILVALFVLAGALTSVPAASSASVASGQLRVTTSPAVPTRVVVDGVARSDWGLDWLGVPVGDHEVCFTDVPGFATPPCRTVPVLAGVTAVVDAPFGPLALLKVEVEPAGLPSTIFVDGVARDEYGLYSYLEPGTRTVCWGDVPGWTAPQCQSVELVPGSTTTVSGTFSAGGGGPGSNPVPAAPGYLRVTTVPPVPARVVVDGVARADWGLTWLKVPAGAYEVCATDVPGYVTPPCRTVSVLAGATTTTTLDFAALGLLKVDVDPAGVPADVVVDGVARNRFGLYSFIEPGPHEICGSLASGWVPPSCASVTVLPGAEARATLRYQAAPTPVFPLRVEAGTRHLVDASGRPFLLTGDTAWSIMVQLDRSEVEAYLDDRRAKGFNAILVNLLEARFGDTAPNNVFGQGPFTQPGDLSAPNEAYWAHVDWVVEQAAARGLLVLATPAYLGYGGGTEGWYQQLVANGVAKVESYGRWIGQRYARFDNLLWVQAGDFDPPQQALVDALAAGIDAVDPGALTTVHTAPESKPLDVWPGRTWLDVNNVYTYQDVWPRASAEYQRTARPYILFESAYENENGATPTRLRTQAWHALLAGATGQIFGNNPIWHFDGPGLWPENTTWQASLQSEGSTSMARVAAIYSALEWWRLAPDLSGGFLTGGAGTGQDRAVAALWPAGRTAVVYVPSRRFVTVDLADLAAGSVDLIWLDPTTDAATVARLGAPTTGTQRLQPPAANASGSSDWILLVRPSA